MESDLASSIAQLEAQQAFVQQAQATLKESDESLNKTAIYSPMDGTVSKLNVELGERVLGSGFSQGTDLMTVADLGKMEAIVDVDENDVVLVSIGDTAKIELDAFKNITYNGVVTQIANSAKTTAAGTQEEVVNFAIKIALNDFNAQVRPGMSCNADIEVETKNNVLAVPIQSVTARSEEEPGAMEHAGLRPRTDRRQDQQEEAGQAQGGRLRGGQGHRGHERGEDRHQRQRIHRDHLRPERGRRSGQRPLPGHLQRAAGQEQGAAGNQGERREGQEKELRPQAETT